MLGEGCRPVRAILFDKTAAADWALGWRQDRTIAVKERVRVDGFGTWSIKSGMLHVEPPFELLSGMVTLRIHMIRYQRVMHQLDRSRYHKLNRLPTTCGSCSALWHSCMFG